MVEGQHAIAKQRLYRHPIRLAGVGSRYRRREVRAEHLAEMAEIASECLRFRDRPTGWPLVSMWATGELLCDAESIEDASVVLLLDLPSNELPWTALHPTGEWVSERLRLGKRPVQWWYRPQTWPAWNPIHRRVIRFWSDRDGCDDEILGALRERRTLSVVEPCPEERRTQLHEELALARRHLVAALDQYYDRDWRRQHQGFGIYPEDHLWRAAQGVREIEDALRDPELPPYRDNLPGRFVPP